MAAKVIADLHNDLTCLRCSNCFSEIEPGGTVQIGCMLGNYNYPYYAAFIDHEPPTENPTLLGCLLFASKCKTFEDKYKRDV